MPSVTLDAWCQAWKPRSALSVTEWGRRHVKLPFSMRSSAFDPDQSYWLIDPLNCASDTSINEVIVIGPPGSSKTTLFEVKTPYCIAEDPGPHLLVSHNVHMTEDWFETRGKPVLKACKPVAALYPDSINRDKKDVIIFDHMPFWIGGANIGDLQSKSCRRIDGDEVWEWKQGMMREARARLHDRWNGQCYFVSQGGDEKIGDSETELFKSFQAGTRERARFICPKCQRSQKWCKKDENGEVKFPGLRYDETKDANGVWDYQAAAKSARWVCENTECGEVFPDEIHVRRSLSATLHYVAENPNPQAKVRSFQYPAFCVWWISWGTLVVEWIQANEAKHRGDYGPLKKFVQKRCAEFWSEELSVPHGALRLSGYTKTQYMEGELWDGELFRFLTIDKQKDHFWALIRAWKQDGSSRLIFEGKVLTESALRDIQQRYRVMDGATFMDARYEPGSVYEVCAKYHWTAVMGEDRKLYTHHPKNRRPYSRYFSPMEKINSGASGYCWRIMFGNEPLKDILSHLRGGHGSMWETPDDISPEFTFQIDSEVKREVVNKVTKEVVMRWCKIRANHLWDCEVLQILGACIANIIGYAEAPQPDAPMPQPPETPQTG